MELGVRYGTVELLLADLFGASHVRETTFRARLKHLSRLGVPAPHLDKKRGKRLSGADRMRWYPERELWRIALCLELAEYGIDPTVIVAFLGDHWEKSILPKFRREAEPMKEQRDDAFLVITPRVMSSAWAGTPPLAHAWEYASQLAGDRERRSPIKLNVTKLIEDLRGVRRVFADTQLSMAAKPGPKPQGGYAISSPEETDKLAEDLRQGKKVRPPEFPAKKQATAKKKGRVHG